jgi:hypothetical protein
MVATVVHFGEDVCYRLPVLRSAGYAVEQCDSLEQFSTFLSSAPDVVVLEEEPQVPLLKAISFTRARSSASLVLFRHDSATTLAEECDLIIPALTAPEEWLSEIATLLQRSCAAREDSRALVRKPATPHQDATAVKEMTREVRARATLQRTGTFEHPPK